jgi:superfamily II DNA or RNA helicase
MRLRDYQVETLNAVQNMWERGYTSSLCSLFTGAGKTEIFIEYVHRYINPRTQRALVLTPAHIIYQTYHRFLLRHPEYKNRTTVNGTEGMKTIGVVMGSYNEPDARIIVGSVPTLIDRVPTDTTPIEVSDVEILENGGVALAANSTRKVIISPRVDAILREGMIDEVIYDEAHHSVSPGGLVLINRLWQLCDILDRPHSKLIGFTATPFREDGIGLGNLFQSFAIQKSVRWGIKNGYLAELEVPIRVHARMDGRSEKVAKAGDWDEVLVTAYQEKANNRLTLAYLPSIEDSKRLAATFNEHGIPAAHIDGECCIDEYGQTLSKESRIDIFDRFIRNEIKVICNFAVLLEAIDLPPASCMIWARDTDNTVLFTQALGRILRLFDGSEFVEPKETALILDATASNLQMLTIGTLSGFRVDENTGTYLDVDPLDAEETIEEEPLLDGLDMRDARPGFVLEADGVTYSVGRIINKSGSDWYHGSDDVLTLSVSGNDTLVIVPPYYTLAMKLDNASDSVLTKIETDDTLREVYDKLVNASTLFSNHTLWHVHNNRKPDTWKRHDISLTLLMDFAIPYAYDVSEVVKSFIKRGAGWKKNDSATMKQRGMLDRLKVEYDATITKGDAAQLITHNLAFKHSVAPRIGEIVREIHQYI